MEKENKKTKRFLTVYTASFSSVEPDWPLANLLLGTFLRRGDAIKECAEYAVEEIERRERVRNVASQDDRVVDALKGIGMSGEEIEELFDVQGDWSIPEKPREAICSLISDIIGGHGCFILQSGCGRFEFRFDVDESAVEGNGGLRLWTCITSGIDDSRQDPEWEQAYKARRWERLSGTDDGCHDAEWEQAFPEVFLTEKDAVHCALDGIMQCLDGYSLKEKKSIIAEAKNRIAEYGHFEFDLNDHKQRRVDVWSTPLDIGGGASNAQRMGDEPLQ